MPNVCVYSRGLYNELPSNILNDKAVIRIHNINDKGWYPIYEENKLVLFFEDYKKYNLKYIDYIKTYLGFNVKNLSKKQAIEIIKFIKLNANKDVVIHCEFGKSRSVAVAMFLRDIYGYKIINKTEKELEKYNDFVYDLLKKYNY